MRKSVYILGFLLIVGCASEEKIKTFSSVAIKTVYTDSVSIRAIEFLDKQTLAFAGSNGMYGSVNTNTDKVRGNVQKQDSILPEFRGVGHTNADFFMLSVANPALLYKTGENGQMELVYQEDGEGVFYDALKFWNTTEGIAVGDSMNGCLSILITRDGGKSWNKLACNVLPKAANGEGAFAASNTNIETVGDKTWVATTEGTIYFSPDRGKSWSVIRTPMLSKKPTEGIYSIDFYDENLGFGIGGDYTSPKANKKNKIITMDGGKTWRTIADNQEPGYKSCVQFVPNSGGKGIVAVGFTGISYSKDQGQTWQSMSEEGFYTIRFLNDSIAYAAGKNRIARLTFK
ncbi:oxidoreductase [Flagellimonas sp. HMM57]|uniref:WD40/YVTN/BNR-like repeat-containing protein n=1 Tax=unclassified Flagellimonas TaxID=2644544 RepID=UPI0013D4E65F|nr:MULTISPECIES: oxidoreductase [unclassified Flagellimonas]UII75494.1 oxidoreductase [Flagellimonas sp. HMM57]